MASANLGEPFGPVQPVADENFLSAAIGVNLNPVTVEFDLVNPLLAFWRFGLQGRSWGLMNPGIWIRLGNNATHKGLREAGIFAQLSRISNNQGT